jgi:hypothetical protein
MTNVTLEMLSIMVVSPTSVDGPVTQTRPPLEELSVRNSSGGIRVTKSKHRSTAKCSRLVIRMPLTAWSTP